MNRNIFSVRRRRLVLLCALCALCVPCPLCTTACTGGTEGEAPTAPADITSEVTTASQDVETTLPDTTVADTTTADATTADTTVADTTAADTTATDINAAETETDAAPETTTDTEPDTEPATETEPETEPPVLNEEESARMDAMLAQDFAGPPLPIGGWATPAPQLRDRFTGVEGSYDAPFALLADAGLTYVVTLEEWSSLNWSLDSLASAHRAGLKLWYNCAGQEADYCMERVQAMLASEHAEALAAVYVKDEPTMDQISEVAASTARFRELLGEGTPLPVFSNLLPTYAGSWLVSSDYRNYLKTYVDATHPEILMFDFYPYQGSSNNLIPDMMVNIALAREEADAAGIPLYSFIQCSSQGTSSREPSLAELRADIHLNLAMGVKGITYFLACEHYPDWEYSTMIDANGQTTAMYEKVKTVNEELAALRGVFLDYDNRGLMIAGYSRGETGLRRKGCDAMLLDTFGPLTSVTAESGGAVVGCFEDAEGHVGFYVANPNYSKGATATLHFDGTQYAVVWSETGASVVDPTADLTLELAPGAGVFVACFQLYQ